MSWRDFKTQSDLGSFKCIRSIKGGDVGGIIQPIHLKLAEGILNNDEEPGPDLFTLIGETLAEIARQGWPWDGWRDRLTDKQRQELRSMEAKIDKAALDGDRLRLERALAAYRELALHERGIV